MKPAPNYKERKRAEKLLVKLGWDITAIRCYGPNETNLEYVVGALRLAEARGRRAALAAPCDCCGGI